MKIIKSILTVILTLALVFAAFAAFALKSGFFTVDARDYVTSFVKKTIGKDVRVGRIELGIIDNVVIHDVSIPVGMTFGQEGEFASIKRVIIRFNIIDLINHRDLDKTLSSIIIDSPLINITKKDNRYNVSDFVNSFAVPAATTATAAVQAPLPINKIRIENGRVVYKDEDRNFTTQISSLSGTVSLKQKVMMLAVSLKGRTKDSGKDNIKLDADYYLNRKAFRGNVEIREAALNDWGAYILDPVNYSINSGSFSLSASVSGEAFKPGSVSVYGYFGLTNGDILIKGSLPVKNINATVEVNNDDLKIKNTGFTFYGGKGELKGRASKIFTQRDFKAYFNLDNVDLGLMSPENMTGTAKAYISVTGSAEKLEAEAAVMWPSGKLLSMDVKDADIKGTMSKGIFKITDAQGTIGGGRLNAAGSADLVSKGRKTGLLFNLTGLEAVQLLKSKDFSGNIDLSFRVSGPADKLKFTAGLKSPVFKYSGNNVENLNGTLTMEGEKIYGSATMAYKKYRNGKLSLKSTLKEGEYTIENLRLDNGPENLAITKGKINLKDGAMDIAVLLNNVMLSDLSIDYLKGRDIDGTVKGGLFIRGTTAAPVLDLNLNMDSLRIRKEKYKLYAGVHYGANVIKINEINFSDSLKGSGEFSLVKKIFNMNFDARSLKGDVVSELTGMKMLDAGIIDGRILLKKEQEGYGGSVNLTVGYDTGIYKGAKIDMTGQGNFFKINRIEINQQKGSLTIDGGINVAANDKITADINGSFRNYRINDTLVLDGSFVNADNLDIHGDNRISAETLKFTKLAFNGKAQDDLDITLKTENLSVREFSAKWGQAYYAEASLDNDGKIPVVNALIRLKDADLYPVYTLGGKRQNPLGPESVIKGDFTVKGPINSADFTGTLSQEKGSMAARGTVGIDRENGKYTLTKIDVKYNAVNINLANFVSIFAEKYGDTGRVNAQGEIKGRLSDIESTGNLMLSQGRVMDMPYDSVNTNYSFKDKKFTLETGGLYYKESFIKLDGSVIDIKGVNDYQAAIKAQMKDFVWQGNMLNGSLNFSGAINTGNGLIMDGSIGSENFAFKKHLFKPFLINVSYRKDRIKLATSKGASKLNADILVSKDRIDVKSASVDEANGNRLLNVSGFIDTRKEGNSNLNIAVSEADPQLANDLLGWDHTWTGTGNGNVKISGSPAKELAYTVSVTLKNGSVDNVPFDLFTGLVSVRDDYVDLSPVDPMLLSKEGKYDVKVTGKIPVALSEASVEKMKGMEMNLHAVVKEGDLSIIKFLSFIDDASGKLDADISIKGTKEFPSMTGKLSIADGEVKLKYLFKDIKNIYANLLIKDNVIDIYNLRGDTERGTLKIANLNEKKGGLMKFMKIDQVNWKVTNIGDKIRFTDTPYLEFVSGDADVDLAVTGPLDSPDIGGTVKLENARIVYPVNTFSKTGEKADIKDNYAMKINWDVAITGGENVRYYKDYLNNYADMTLKFDNGPLKISGRGKEMKLAGNIGVSKGTYKYMNTELSLDTTRQSRVIFDSEKTPLLDVWSSTTIRKIDMSGSYSEAQAPGGLGFKGSQSTSQVIDSLDIEAHFYGRVGNVKLDLTSEPTYNKNTLLYILTFGVAPRPNMNMDDAYKYIDVMANSWFKGGTEQIKKWTPLDVIDIKTRNLNKLVQGGGSATSVTTTVEESPGLEFGLGKTIGQNWYVEYRPKLMDITNQFGQFNIEQKISGEYSINNATKFVAEGIFRDKNLYPTSSFEGKIGLEIGSSWDQWGAKPTPAPTALPTAVTGK
jgi:autotransporter translocation and assembly factor TamB